MGQQLVAPIALGGTLHQTIPWCVANHKSAHAGASSRNTSAHVEPSPRQTSAHAGAHQFWAPQNNLVCGPGAWFHICTTLY